MEENCLTQLQNAIQATLENQEFQAPSPTASTCRSSTPTARSLKEAVDSVLDAPEELVTLLEHAYEGQ